MLVLVVLSVPSSAIGVQVSQQTWSLKLPRETRYVPRLLVTRDLILDAKAQGIELPNIEPEIGFKILALEAPMEVLVQELSGLSLEEVRRYNPCIRSDYTAEPYQLVLPSQQSRILDPTCQRLSPRLCENTSVQSRSGDT